MRIIKTSYEVVGPNGKEGGEGSASGASLITMFRIAGLRLRKKVLVKAVAKRKE